jgi:hypothetical protein
MNEVQLSMTLAEFLNEARRTGGAAMLEVPENYVLRQPPAVIIAVTGDDVRQLQEMFSRRFNLHDDDGDGLIITP